VELIDAHAAAWIAELPQIDGLSWVGPEGPRFHRGFPCFLRVDSPDALGEALERAFAAAPITRLELGKEGNYLKGTGRLAGRDWMPRVRELVLDHADSTNDTLAALAASPAVAGLTKLRANHSSPYVAIDKAAARAVAQSPYFAGLIELEISGHDFGDDAAKQLAKSPHLTQLRAFRSTGVDMSCSSLIRGPGAYALVKSPTFCLTELALPWHSTGSEGARLIAESPHSAGLRRLDLAHNRIGDEGGWALARSPHLNADCELLLAGNWCCANAGLVRELKGRFRRLKVV
jgi:hypothetical protein